MSPADAYRSQDATRWTRIELLLELFHRAIDALECARTAETRNDEHAVTRELIEAQRFVGGLVAGLNPDAGDVAENLRQSYLGVVQHIGDREIEPAIRILSILREGFEGIRPQAIALEATGELPRLDAYSVLQLDV